MRIGFQDNFTKNSPLIKQVEKTEKSFKTHLDFASFSQSDEPTLNEHSLPSDMRKNNHFSDKSFKRESFIKNNYGTIRKYNKEENHLGYFVDYKV